VLSTERQLQLVLIVASAWGGDREEVHSDLAQFFREEAGKGQVWIDAARSKIENDTATLIPAGARHNIKNTGRRALKLFNLYAPPEHFDGIVQSDEDRRTDGEGAL
jgi:mannose-6-phosphate isomerase-like protein (cupin superfamily)